MQAGLFALGAHFTVGPEELRERGENAHPANLSEERAIHEINRTAQPVDFVRFLTGQQ